MKFHSIIDFVEIKQITKIGQIVEIQRLDLGEIEAISLAKQLKLPLLIEETLGRRIASRAGIKISGIAGQIVKAFRENLISATEAQSKLTELFDSGRINRKIYNSLFEAVN